MSTETKKNFNLHFQGSSIDPSNAGSQHVSLMKIEDANSLVEATFFTPCT